MEMILIGSCGDLKVTGDWLQVRGNQAGPCAQNSRQTAGGQSGLEAAGGIESWSCLDKEREHGKTSRSECVHQKVEYERYMEVTPEKPRKSRMMS